jgi:hypothetical protein
MRECPAIAAAEIERLRSNGIQPTLDEMAWLMSLGERVESPPAATNPLLGAVPVVAGCEPFFRLTCQARWWLSLAREWFAGVAIAHALGYAYRHGRTPGAFDALVTPAAAQRAVAEWRRRLPITDDELMDAIDRLVDNDAPARPGEEPSEENHAQRVAQAEAISGIPVDAWKLRTQDELYAVIIEGLRLAGQYGGGDTTDAARHSESALVDLMVAAAEIEKRHRDGK